MAVHFHNDRQSRPETSFKPRIFRQHLTDYGRYLAPITYHRCAFFVDFLGSLLLAEPFVSMFLLIILQQHLGVSATTKVHNRAKRQAERPHLLLSKRRVSKKNTRLLGNTLS